MAGTKRRAITTDDLMRRQEGPDRKRMRRTPVVWRGGDSDEEAAVSSDGEEPETEEYATRKAWSEDNNDADSRDDALEATPSDRFNFSRFASKPRTQLAESMPSQALPSTFMSLGVSPPLQASLSSMSIRTPTEIQAACIPPLLAGEFYPPWTIIF